MVYFLFVATRANLIPSNNLITLAEADVAYSEFGDSLMSKPFKLKAPRVLPPEGVAAPLLSFELWSPTRQLVCSFVPLPLVYFSVSYLAFALPFFAFA